MNENTELLVVATERKDRDYWSTLAITNHKGAKDMLTLTVKNDETIYIGDDIQIKVQRNGNQTRVSIDAPRDIPILREKLLNQQDNQ